MADFTLYDGDWGENVVSVLPILKKERLIDLQMYLVGNRSDINDKEEFIISYEYKDVVLLRDYLTSVINLFEGNREQKPLRPKNNTGHGS